MIAAFLSNISAKCYENLTMLSRVIAKNIGDVFLRHSVVVGLLLSAFEFNDVCDRLNRQQQLDVVQVERPQVNDYQTPAITTTMNVILQSEWQFRLL